MSGPAPVPAIVLRVCLVLIRAASVLVPRAVRGEWVQEWEAEIRHRWLALREHQALTRRNQAILLRHTGGALADAAWLRQQFTLDAEVFQDVRHGFRLLRASPGFTVVAVLALALGIGASTAVFTVVDDQFLRPLPWDQEERVVTLWQTRGDGAQREEVAPADFLDIRARARSFVEVAAADPWSFDYSGGGDPEVIYAALVTEGFFGAAGVTPQLGRTFRREEHVPGRANVVVLSDGLWRARFGSDPAIVGRPVTLDGRPYTVVGVLPPLFDLRLTESARATQAWAPKVIADHETRTRGGGWWGVIARLKPGMSVAQAQAELEGIAGQLEAEHPRTNHRVGAVVLPLRDHLVGGVRPALLVLAGAVVLVLLVACGNVANLLLARGAARCRELAVRATLGASRARLVRQLLAEGLLLAALGGAAGLTLGAWCLHALVALAPSGVAPIGAIVLDRRAVAFAAALSTLTALVFGLAPAMQLARRELVDAVHRGGGLRVSASTGRVRTFVAAAEIALAVVLLVGTALLGRSFTRLLDVHPGFTSGQVQALQVFAWDRQRTPDQRIAFFEEALARIRRLPGVVAAAAGSAPPFMTADLDILSPVWIQGEPPPPSGQEPRASITIATPDYFTVLDIPLRGGRFFEVADTAGKPAVALVNDAFARRHWSGGRAVGRRVDLRWHGQPVSAEIVGVVGSIRHTGLELPPRPEIFLPHAQTAYGSMTFVVRTAGDPGVLTRPVKQQVWALDPMMTFYEVASLDSLVDRTVAGRRSILLLVAFLSAAALALAALGVYGVVSFATMQQTREFGIRLALGAGAPSIVGLVLRQGVVLAGAGVATGFLCAAVLTRFLASMLFGVTAADPASFAAAGALVVAFAAVASYVPARRATRVDPVAALRAE